MFRDGRLVLPGQRLTIREGDNLVSLERLATTVEGKEGNATNIFAVVLPDLGTYLQGLSLPVQKLRTNAMVGPLPGEQPILKAASQ